MKHIYRFTGLITLLLIIVSIPKTTLFYHFLRQLYFFERLNTESTNLCQPLQYRLERYTTDFSRNISLSVLNEQGVYVANINPNLQRIPASNQKLISSAYALDKLGPDYLLTTTLYVNNIGQFILYGNGDPDFTKEHIEDLVRKIIKYNLQNNNAKRIQLILVEENPSTWSPDGWSKIDKSQEYGAPITRLALLSNSSDSSIKNPLDTFKEKIRDHLKLNGFSVSFSIMDAEDFSFNNNLKRIYTIKSAPLYALLNLVNSESHNFTSEVIFRIANKNWSYDELSNIPTDWYKYMHLDINNVFSDASGISRRNNISTIAITKLLRRMNIHRYSDYYFSSFSIIGVRGTLSNFDNNLKGKFIGKSGTLNNVKSLSGLLIGKDNNHYVSVIATDLHDPLKHILKIVEIIYKETEFNCIN